MPNNQYSGNAYEGDDIDSRADLSNPATRLAVAGRVLRAKRPFNIDQVRYDAVFEWASGVMGGRDSLPPSSVGRFLACRWPNEPASSNGARADSAARQQ